MPYNIIISNSWLTTDITLSATPGISPTATATLTTIFTPPPECNTPLAIGDDNFDVIILAAYLPFIQLPIPWDQNSNPELWQCLPETTTDSEGAAEAVYEYDPGQFCPEGMTTATSMGTYHYCCHSDLTYDTILEACMGSKTLAMYYLGTLVDGTGVVSRTIDLSGTDTTLPVTARAISLVRNAAFGNVISTTTSDTIRTTTASAYPTRTSTEAHSNTTSLIKSSTSISSIISSKSSFTTSISNNTTIVPSTTAAPAPPPTPTGPGNSKSSRKLESDIGLTIGLVALFAIVALGFIVFARYRRRRLLSRRRAVAAKLEESDIELDMQTLPPRHALEIPAICALGELEGSWVEGRGAGIHVHKPELEGTAAPRGGLAGVFVKKKWELEARSRSRCCTPASGTGAAAERPDSPVIIARPPLARARARSRPPTPAPEAIIQSWI
ncbi:hypothetical protein F4777DRAFT_323662 [Nemania sp. FL0916]|nr:hypothetical protein F4777DRAFT_323662 [Nemania sp. FL0916]